MGKTAPAATKAAPGVSSSGRGERRRAGKGGGHLWHPEWLEMELGTAPTTWTKLKVNGEWEVKTQKGETDRRLHLFPRHPEATLQRSRGKESLRDWAFFLKSWKFRVQSGYCELMQQTKFTKLNENLGIPISPYERQKSFISFAIWVNWIMNSNSATQT